VCSQSSSHSCTLTQITELAQRIDRALGCVHSNRIGTGTLRKYSLQKLHVTASCTLLEVHAYSVHRHTLYDAIVASRSEAAAAASLTKNCSRCPCDNSGPGSVTLPSCIRSNSSSAVLQCATTACNNSDKSLIRACRG
jgi:hypothetical protein